MPKPSAFRRYLRFFGPDLDADIDDELTFHIEARIQESLARGATPEQARAEALQRFGDVERVRRALEAIGRDQQAEQRRIDLIDELRQDIAFAVRSLRKAPVFAAIALITLALGIGANTAVFSVVRGVLLRDLPYPGADRIAILWSSMPGLGFQKGNVSNAEILDVRTRTNAFESVGAFRGFDGTLTGRGEPEKIDGLGITASVFDVLKTSAVIGRTFTAQEDVRSGPKVIVLADAYWRRRFAGDRSIVGQSLEIDGEPHTVIGIMPPSFTLEKAEVYLPLRLNTDSTVQQRGWHNFVGLARLKRGVSVEQANAQLHALASQLTAELPASYPRDMQFGLMIQPLQDALVGGVRRPLLVLFAAVALVLLIACVNVANLMLVRAESRQREFAVRLALGAGGGRIVRQLLTESAVLSLIGGALGVCVALAGVRALLAVSAGAVPRAEGVHVDGIVLLVTLVVSTAAGLLAGLAPSFRAARPRVQEMLREEGRGASASGVRLRARNLLMIGELSLATIVLVAAGLLGRSFWRLAHAGVGLRTDHVLAMSVTLPGTKYRTFASTKRFFTEYENRISHLPGVTNASVAFSLPTTGHSNWDIDIAGRPRAPGQTAPSPVPEFVSPSYFATLDVPLRAGRLLDAHDDNPGALVAVVNEAFAKRLMPEGAVGQRFRMAGDSTAPWITVVGVVGNVKLSGPAENAEMQWMTNLAAADSVAGFLRGLWVIARTTGDPSSIAPAARRELLSMDPTLAFNEVLSMDAMLARSIARPRFTMLLLATFALLALVLASVGVYGVVAYAVAQRTREMGIRMALGARGADVLRLVLRHGMAVALVGVVIGLALASLATRLLDDILFQIPPRDLATFGGTALLLALVVAVATLIPAVRATRVDPVIALRE